MGNLKPGATYVYEKADGVTYAREVGAPANTRQAIGWDYDPKELMKNNMWNQILLASKTNPLLQDALDRVIVIYELSKQEDM